jgi:hypothetical protein
LPRRFGWLVQQVPQAAPFGSQLQHLLTDPEMAAVLANTPRLGRVLRPLCHMLGVLPAPGQIPPPSPRTPPRHSSPASLPLSQQERELATDAPAAEATPPPLEHPRACGPPDLAPVPA